MSQFPCKNPSCHSFGTPHPNCKCYGGMALGGAVSNFCDTNRLHAPGCEYFAEGGASNLLPVDPAHAVAGHIANSGLYGILRMVKDLDLGKYDKSVAKGHKTMDTDVERLLNNERIAKPEDRRKFHDAIHSWIEKGGVSNDIREEQYKQNSPVAMAEGGLIQQLPAVVHGHPIEQAYPDQNIMLNATKGRVSNYLTGLKPQDIVPKLAFDQNPDQTQQKKKYRDAIKIADHPMSILHEVSKGTVSHEHLAHMNAMYPELNDAIQKKITEKIIKTQLDGKKPSHKIRQGLSLLMGTPLSGELAPQNIQAAQAVFSTQKADQAPQSSAPVKKSKTSLSKSEQAFQTGEQSLVRRSQKV